MADGFLGRWSRRKAGKEAEEAAPLNKAIDSSSQAPQASPVENASDETPPLPTLEDVAKIDRFDPDFSVFMKPDVDPVVQQAALKKMFTDPHFNIMDGLDIYIDDYSKPDPLPPGMLERMVQSDMLNLFRKPKEELPLESEKSASQVPPPQLPGSTAEVEGKTDLTSVQRKSGTQLDEVPNESLIKPEQKKT